MLKVNNMPPSFYSEGRGEIEYKDPYNTFD